MSKALEIIMAGVIAGLVAFATSQLGIGGTILGAVLGSILYQIISHFFEKPIEGLKTQKVEREIFFVFPLVIILGIELIYLLSTVYNPTEQIFYILEDATGGNLFRAMGIGLIIMGIYPIIQPESIKRIYGYILVAVGVIKLLWGFVDVNSSLVMLYAPLFYQLNELISVIVIAALAFVIVAIARESVTIIMQKDEESEDIVEDKESKDKFEDRESEAKVEDKESEVKVEKPKDKVEDKGTEEGDKVHGPKDS